MLHQIPSFKTDSSHPGPGPCLRTAAVQSTGKGGRTLPAQQFQVLHQHLPVVGTGHIPGWLKALRLICTAPSRWGGWLALCHPKEVQSLTSLASSHHWSLSQGLPQPAPEQEREVLWHHIPARPGAHKWLSITRAAQCAVSLCQCPCP